jgi:hypothetical protein
LSSLRPLRPVKSKPNPAATWRVKTQKTATSRPVRLPARFDPAFLRRRPCRQPPSIAAACHCPSCSTAEAATCPLLALWNLIAVRALSCNNQAGWTPSPSSPSLLVHSSICLSPGERASVGAFAVTTAVRANVRACTTDPVWNPGELWLAS